MARKNKPRPVFTPYQALLAARALIADPAHWTKSAAARLPLEPRQPPTQKPLRLTKSGKPRKPKTPPPEYGKSVSPLDRHAVQWTGTGALMALTGVRTNAPGAVAYSMAAIGRVDLPALGRWEDDRATTHAMVMAAFDKALLSTGNPPAPPAAARG